MKPACWEACFLYPCPTVEHSNNCLLLLCRLFLKPSGHYTNLVSYLKTQGAQVFGTGSTGWNSTKRTAYVTQNLIVPTITGYAPIGVLQWALGSDTDENYKYVSVSKINIMENGKLEVGIVNNSDYDATNLLLYVVFLYIKSL